MNTSYRKFVSYNSYLLKHNPDLSWPISEYDIQGQAETFRDVLVKDSQIREYLKYICYLEITFLDVNSLFPVPISFVFAPDEAYLTLYGQHILSEMITVEKLSLPLHPVFRAGLPSYHREEVFEKSLNDLVLALKVLKTESELPQTREALNAERHELGRRPEGRFVVFYLSAPNKESSGNCPSKTSYPELHCVAKPVTEMQTKVDTEAWIEVVQKTLGAELGKVLDRYINLHVKMNEIIVQEGSKVPCVSIGAAVPVGLWSRDPEGSLYEFHSVANLYFGLSGKFGEKEAKLIPYTIVRHLSGHLLYANLVAKGMALGRTSQAIADHSAQAHELSHLLPVIDSVSSKEALDTLRAYMYMVFGIGALDGKVRERRLLPPRFAEGDRFHEFVENALAVAGQVECIAKKNKIQARFITKDEIDREVELACKRKRFASPDIRLNAEMPDNTRTWVSAAIVCAFRNILQHSTDIEIQIGLEMNLGSTFLTMRNAGFYEARQKYTSTLLALKAFVQKYAPNRTDDVYLDNDPGKQNAVLTKIPLPVDFFLF